MPDSRFSDLWSTLAFLPESSHVLFKGLGRFRLIFVKFKPGTFRTGYYYFGD